MSSKIMRGLVVGSALVFVLGLMPAAVFAEEGESDENTTTSAPSQKDPNESDEDEGSDLKGRLEELKQQREDNKQHRLEANKLRVCELHKTKITAIIGRSITRAKRQLELFTRISDRVKAFYVKKGYNVANYSELVAAADAAKAKAQADLDTLQNLDAFDCNSDDPKGQTEIFKMALKTVNQDLKDYRTAVKNLIVAVKSANSQSSGEQEGEQ